MKKMLIWMAVGGVLVFGAFAWLKHVRSKDPGYPVGLALGASSDGNVELNVLVSAGMVSGQDGGGLSDEWVAQHFELRAASGQAVALRPIARSALISEASGRDAVGYLQAQLRLGVAHTLDFLPGDTNKFDGYTGRPTSPRYRHTLTPAPEGAAFQRLYFAAMAR